MGFDKLSTYGISSLSETTLKDVINTMILGRYLILTGDEYPLLRLGQRANGLLTEDERLELKVAVAPEETSRRPDKVSQSSTQYDEVLFNQLRAVRVKIASEQKVPAFVVFSDSTLLDMCQKMPASEYEFLQVNGVGAVKLERYGERFLRVIRDYANSNL